MLQGSSGNFLAEDFQREVHGAFPGHFGLWVGGHPRERAQGLLVSELCEPSWSIRRLRHQL